MLKSRSATSPQSRYAVTATIHPSASSYHRPPPGDR